MITISDQNDLYYCIVMILVYELFVCYLITNLRKVQTMGLQKKIEGRLKFIDFELLFCGSISRKKLIDEFGIQTAGATRDLSKYKDMAPENLLYDHVNRTYYATENFEPIFDHDPNTALTYFMDKNINIRCETSTILRPLRRSIVSQITRAINNGNVIELTYHNPKTGTKERYFIPHSFVNDGLRWHVRGFCRLRQNFIDLVISRIENIKMLDDDVDVTIEAISEDRQWNRYVDLEIVPHPEVKHKTAIEYEHQMENGALTVEVRAAVAGYFLRGWNIDCSEQHTLNPVEHTLWLRNTAALYGVGNLIIAPGYGM